MTIYLLFGAVCGATGLLISLPDGYNDCNVHKSAENMKHIFRTPLKFCSALVLSSLLATGCSSNGDWHTASRESAGIAPDPAATREAVLQVYGADTWGWRGWFAIHTWIAAKKTGENVYTVYDVVGWRNRHGKPVLRIAEDIPDRYWFGAKPRVLKEYRGKGVDQLIDAVDKAARAYPWKTTYQTLPGPNSNTFTAWIANQVPELHLDLPFSAFGSGYVDREE